MLVPFTSLITNRVFTMAVAVVLASAAHAVPDDQFHNAYVHFSQAQAGDKSAVDQAADDFSVLLAAEPGNPVLMAYTGAATAMRSSTTMLPWKKMSYAEDGLALIDKALALLTPAHNAVMQNGTPGALTVRFVAANTFLAVPGFMNRHARGVKLLDEVLASPLLVQSPLGFQGAVWMRAAKLAEAEQRPDDARKFLNEVVNQNAPQAQAARARLKALAS